MKYHKEEVAEVGTEMCYVKHCTKTRCAFVKTATRNKVSTDLMYIYQPQGLDRQAAEQGGLLARFQSAEMAACFLNVLHAKLEMSFMAALFRSWNL